MLQNLLLPNRFKKIGWFIFIPSFILGLLIVFFNFSPFYFDVSSLGAYFSLAEEQWNKILEKSNIYAVVGSLFIIGGLFVGFSKEKKEDEFISQIRLSSLLWAVILNYILLLIGFLCFYGFAFLNIVVYNMFTVLIIFIFRFNYILLSKSKKMTNAE